MKYRILTWDAEDQTYVYIATDLLVQLACNKFYSDQPIRGQENDDVIRARK